ncbi:MAG: hypothetical protein IJC43_07890 [Clostridia bacterium]|nr:hypothetical protein [Clostridia bacterium]
MKLRDIIRRHPILSLLALPPVFLAASYLMGLLLGPVLFDSPVGAILFLPLAFGAPFLFPYFIYKGVEIFFDQFESLKKARQQEEQQPGSVAPEELNRLQLRAALAVLIPTAFVTTTFGYTVLLGNPIFSM